MASIIGQAEIVKALQRSSSPHPQPNELPRRGSLKGRFVAKVLKVSRSTSVQLGSNSTADISPIGRSSSDSYPKPASKSKTLVPEERPVPRLSSEQLHANTRSRQHPISSLDLKITPELESLDINAERDIWVAVEVSTLVNDQLADATSTSLDLAIILDNSAYTSPKALQTATWVISQISHLLTADSDRLALFCTTCAHSPEALSTCCSLRSLQNPQPSRIEKALHDALLHRSTDIQRGLDSGATLAAANRCLAGYGELFTAKRRTTPAVIVVSPNPEKCIGAIGHLSPYPVYVIDPGIIPWTADNQPINVRWWASASVLSKQPCSPSSLKTLLNLVRQQSLPGTIRNVRLDVRSMSRDGKILEIVGPTAHKSMVPGQTATIMVRMSITASKATNENITSPDALFLDLDRILGTANTPLINIRAAYQHSLFPSNTHLIVSHTMSLPRPNLSSKWNAAHFRPSLDSIRQQKALQATVYKRLMLCLASDAISPRDALARLIHAFSKPQDSYSNDVAMSLGLVREELAYRSSLKIDSSVGTRPNATRLHSSGSSVFFVLDNVDEAQQEHGHHRASSLTSSASSLRSTSSTLTVLHNDAELNFSNDPNSTAFINSTSGAGLEPSGGKDDFENHDEDENEDEDEDAARKIWKHMRKDSKGRPSSLTLFCTSPGLAPPSTSTSTSNSAYINVHGNLQQPDRHISKESERQERAKGMEREVQGNRNQTPNLSPPPHVREKMQQISAMALRSRRSIGQDTLWSLSLSLGGERDMNVDADADMDAE